MRAPSAPCRPPYDHSRSRVEVLLAFSGADEDAGEVATESQKFTSQASRWVGGVARAIVRRWAMARVPK